MFKDTFYSIRKDSRILCFNNCHVVKNKNIWVQVEKYWIYPITTYKDMQISYINNYSIVYLDHESKTIHIHIAFLKSHVLKS